MALKAPKGGTGPQQDNLVPGTYPGRVVQIIDFGLQPQRPYKGEDKKPCNEIGLTYELVDEFMKDENGEDILDKPRWISETLPFYGLFAEKAKSTQRYLALDPQEVHEGDFAALIGMPCNVLVVNNASGDKVYDNVSGISAMRPRDAAACAPLVNDPKVFDLDAPDMEVFNKFPKWIQDKLKANLNFAGSPLEEALGGGKDKPKSQAKARAKPVDDQDDDDQADNNPY